MHQTVESVDRETFERVWKIVEEIGVQERHFNGLQTGYRNMASAWLLAAFTGIGFVFSDKLNFPTYRELVVAAIAAAAAIGIALLWVLDLLVYHRLLQSCFIEGLVLEERYPWLPPVRDNMMKTQKSEGVLFRVVGFYLGPIVLLVLIAAGASAFWSYCHNWPRMGTFLAGAGIVAAIVAGISIRVKTADSQVLEERLAAARKETEGLRALNVSES